MKALVVDDDLITRILLQAILSDHAEVHCCVDGSEAVLAHRSALERGDPYDLICMDILMPVMGGIEALALIRRQEEVHLPRPSRHSKVIIATATDDTEPSGQAFRQLCDAYIVKPVDARKLLDILRCLFPPDEPPA